MAGRYPMVKKTTFNNIKFDSKAEARRYVELLILKKARKIKHLDLQVRYKITIGGVDVKYASGRHLTYVADFTYIDENGREVVEDVKGHQTDVSKIKIALMAAMGHEVKLIKGNR